MRTTSLTGSKYFLTFIDDYSRFTHTAFLKHKSETLSHFLSYQSLVETQLDRRIRVFRTDHGGEFTSQAFTNHCLAHGIQRQYSIPYTPQQNGVAERKNRTLLDAARCMLHVCGRPHSYWEEAVATACYLQNRLFSTTLPNQTPYHRWFGHTPDLSHTRIFGCEAYAVSTNPHRGKFDSKVLSSVFVGYGERFGHKAYLYDPNACRFLFSRSVIFNELSLLKSDESSSTNNLSTFEAPTHSWEPTSSTKSSLIAPPPFTSSQAPTTSLNQVNHTSTPSSLPLLTLPLVNSHAPSSHENSSHAFTPTTLQDSSSSTPQHPSFPLSPPHRMRSLADIYAQLNITTCNPPLDPIFPDPLLLDDGISVDASLSSPQAHLWRAAMDDEIASLRVNDTWFLAPLPLGRTPISCKWVLRYKLKADGSVERYKARMVARGFSQ